MATVAELLSLPPARALLGTMTHDRTGLTGRYTMELDFLFPATGPGAAAPSPSLQVHRSRRPFENNGGCAWCLVRGRSKSL